VGFREGGTDITLPDRTRVTGAIRTCLTRHVEREIFPQVDSLQKRLRANPGDIRSKNQLALVHARYGLYDQALEGFLDILKRQDYPAALTNAANVYYLKGDFTRALEFYNRAISQNERNKSALIGSARCHYELENYGLVKQAYARLQELDPDLAGRYAYLALQGDEDARASAVAELSRIVVWEDVE
jgi:tetratricopeptide (TPR) repeat protein